MYSSPMPQHQNLMQFSSTSFSSPHVSNLSEGSKSVSRFEISSEMGQGKGFSVNAPEEYHIHQPIPSASSLHIHRPSPLLQSQFANQMTDSSPFPVSQSIPGYINGFFQRSLDGLYASPYAAPTPLHFQPDPPHRNVSSPLSRGRPSLEQVIARSSSALKRRSSIGEFSSPSLMRPEEGDNGNDQMGGVVDEEQGGLNIEDGRRKEGVSELVGVDEGLQSLQTFNHSYAEDNGGEEELTPPPLMDYQFSDSGSEAEPRAFEREEDTEKVGILDNLLNGSNPPREEDQVRWKSRRDSSANTLLSLHHQGSPSLDHEFPPSHLPHVPLPHHHQQHRSADPSTSTPSTGTSRFIAHPFPQVNGFQPFSHRLPATPNDGRYLHGSKLAMTERTLSDPFIPSPHIVSVPFFASPLPPPSSSYRASMDFARHHHPHHRREPSRTEPECYWHSSPSNTSVTAPSVHSAPSPEDEAGDDLSVRASSEVEDILLSPDRSESVGIRSNTAGSDVSTPRMEGRGVNVTSVASPAWTNSTFSAMGSLVQAGLLAAEREEAIGGRSGDSADDSEKEKTSIKVSVHEVREEDSGIEEGWEAGKEKTLPASESKKSKKKKSEVEFVTDMSHIQECDLPPQGIPDGPRSMDKPSYSYAALIGQCILAHPRQRLSLAEIYTWISTAYPFYRKGDPGWMNSIRHNLSLNKCFIKVEREKGGPQGKGMLWAIQPGTEHQFDGGGFKKKASAANSGKESKGSSSKAKAGSPAPPQPKTIKVKRGLPEPEMFYEQDTGLMGPPKPPAFAPVPPAKKARKEPGRFQNEWTHPTSSRAREVFGDSLASSPSASSSANAFEQPYISSGGYPYTSHLGLHAPHLPRSSLQEQLSVPKGQDLDDFTTPRRPISRGPTDKEPVGSSGQTILPPSALAGLPHLTPSISSPVSSSPGPATLPRPSLIQAHQALLKSSLRDPENVTIVEEEGPAEHQMKIPTQEDGDGGSLQPGFQFSQAHHPSQQQQHPPPSPSPHFPTSNTINHNVYSPVSSLRATANEDEAHEPTGWINSMVPNPIHNPMAPFAHLSPLQSRKVSGSSKHRRGLSATGELIAHAMNPPSLSSPRRPLQKPYIFPGGPMSPASTRKIIPYTSSTPKSAFPPMSTTARTPAAQTPYSLTNQSPAGAAMLQHRAEMGILGSGLGFDDYGAYGDFQPGTPRLEDPYDSSRAVEDELLHLSARNTGSPHWGGMGTPRIGLGVGGGWSFSPGIGFGDRLRNSSN